MGIKPLRAGKRQRQRPTPIVADGCGLRAWPKLLRSLRLRRRSSGRLESRNSSWLWPACLVEAGAKRLKALKAGKRQA